MKFDYKMAAMFMLLSVKAFAADESLCKSNENHLWSCWTGEKTYSLCASKDLNDSIGYLQYRVGKIKKLEFTFPHILRHPKGIFEFYLMAHGASLYFKNGEYTYFIAEDLKGKPVISVEKSDKILADIRCRNSTYTLTNTSTIDFFKLVGIYD